MQSYVGFFTLRSATEQYSVQFLNGQCMPCGSVPALFKIFRAEQAPRLSVFILQLMQSCLLEIPGIAEKKNRFV